MTPLDKMKNINKIKFKTVDPEKTNFQEVHHLLLGGVTPRPIALVSTISEEGINNLAPFSFFNAFGAHPPYVAFSPSFSGRDGKAKDTLLNLRKIPECVIHAVPFELVEQMNLASSLYAAEIDEFVKSGFTPMPSDLVKPMRVMESPFHMECLVEQIIELGGTNGSGNLVLCRVAKFHVAEKVLNNGIIDPQLLDIVGRNASSFYTRASGAAIFEVTRPKPDNIGVDKLPAHIKNSNVLSGNHLGKLGNLNALPQENTVREFIESFSKTEYTTDESDILETKNYQVTCGAGLSMALSDRKKAKELIETAARKALEVNDVDFAIKALLSIEMI